MTAAKKKTVTKTHIKSVSMPDWFAKLSPTARAQYLKDHPNSALHKVKGLPAQVAHFAKARKDWLKANKPGKAPRATAKGGVAKKPTATKRAERKTAAAPGPSYKAKWKLRKFKTKASAVKALQDSAKRSQADLDKETRKASPDKSVIRQHKKDLAGIDKSLAEARRGRWKAKEVMYTHVRK